MNTPDSILPLAVRRRELAPVRFERLKVSLRFVASFALLAVSLLPASGQSAAEFKQPDYSQFKVEDGQITLEFWSWVGGLDQVVKEFEKVYPNINVHVNNIGAGPTEYTKLQTVLKAGSGAPDVVHKRGQAIKIHSSVLTENCT
jgi:ABC-type glycerol-3-phosphate transport system substrate-binding protein